MKITNVHTENTGGNCMVTYIDVQDCDNIVQIGVDDESIVTFTTRYQDTEACMEEHTENAFYSEYALRTRFSDEETEDILQVLYAYCRRYNLQPGFQLSDRNLRNWRFQHIKRTSNKPDDLQIVKFIETIQTETTLDFIASLEPCGPAVSIPVCELGCELADLMTNLLINRHFPE